MIADPESTELNRAQLQFKRNGNLFIAGRQRIILDNARFIGNVGWRQNEQTFDAATYKNTSIDNLSLFYGYINDVQRIFGSDAPSGTGTDDFESDSHLINAAYTLAEGHKLTAYAYLLDFDNSAANSSDTLGLNYTFKGKITDGYTLKGYAEFAYQDDGGDNPTDYEALYYHLNGSIIRDGYSATLGYEVLGSDEGIASFRTPLATAHKFNGWNDQFLSTPTSGLQDAYIGIALPVPKYPVQLIYHYFTADDDSSFYGQEIDAVIAHKLSPKTKAIAKASYYDANGYNVDCTRFSLELNYKY